MARNASEMMARRLAALLLVLAVAIPAFADSSQEVPVGGALRDLSLLGLNGPMRSLRSFHGRPLIINVWASWCGPCQEEMASLERLAWRDQDRYFAVIGISTDDDADRAIRLLKNSNATLSHFIDRNLEMEHMLGASRLPLTVLVGSDGRILKKVYGAREWDDKDALLLIDTTFHRKLVRSP